MLKCTLHFGKNVPGVAICQSSSSRSFLFSIDNVFVGLDSGLATVLNRTASDDVDDDDDRNSFWW